MDVSIDFVISNLLEQVLAIVAVCALLPIDIRSQRAHR